jgi:hypothetical protein
MPASICETLREQPVTEVLVSPNSRTIKLQQCAKIAELRQALLIAGFRSLDSQAVALGLGRSTAWSVLRAGHKSTGLTGSVIRRMSGSSELPEGARRVLEQYVAQKLAGAYGHDEKQLRRFRNALSNDPLRLKKTSGNRSPSSYPQAVPRS